MTLVVKARTTPRPRNGGAELWTRPPAMTALEREVAREYRNAARLFGSSWDVGAIREALRNGGVQALLQSAPFDRLSGALARLAQPFHQALLRGGARMPTEGGFRYSFNASDPRALAYAEQQAARLVTNVTDSTRASINQIVNDSFIQQRTVDQTAWALQDVVGVTERGARQLSNAYENALQERLASGASLKDATEYATRSREVLSDRLVASRAETIARTEILRAENAGRYLGWAQGVEGGQIDPLSRKEWIAGDCDICKELDGEVVMWDAEFSIGVDMPPAHPNCVCTAVILPLTRR